MAPVAFTSSRAVRKCPARACTAKAVPAKKSASIATVGVAAAVLLSATPAFAGVTLEQPKLKNFVKEAEAPAQVERSMKLPKDRAQKGGQAAEKVSESSGPSLPSIAPPAFNTQALWPLGIVGVAGALFAATKVDPGTKDLFDNAVKDSSSKGVGIGTEDALKNSGGYAAPYYERNGSPGGGTKALKRAPKKAKKAGFF